MLVFMTNFRQFSVLRQYHDLDSRVSHVEGFVNDIGDAARIRESFQASFFSQAHDRHRTDTVTVLRPSLDTNRVRIICGLPLIQGVYA